MAEMAVTAAWLEPEATVDRVAQEARVAVAVMAAESLRFRPGDAFALARGLVLMCLRRIEKRESMDRVDMRRQPVGIIKKGLQADMVVMAIFAFLVMVAMVVTAVMVAMAATVHEVA